MIHFYPQILGGKLLLTIIGNIILFLMVNNKIILISITWENMIYTTHIRIMWNWHVGSTGIYTISKNKRNYDLKSHF